MIVCAASTTRPSRRRSTGRARGSSGRPAAARRPGRPADVDDGSSAAARARPRTTCCTSTRRPTTASLTRSPGRSGRTAGSASGAHGETRIGRRTAASCCVVDVATMRSVRRRWSAAAAGFTGAARSSAASVNESSMSMSANRRPLIC